MLRHRDRRSGLCSDSIVAYRDRIAPKADLDELHTSCSSPIWNKFINRIQKLEKSVQKPSKTRDEELRELALMHRVQEPGAPRSRLFRHPQRGGADYRDGFGFLTLKPAIVVVNVGESDASKPPPFRGATRRDDDGHGRELEAEISQLDEADRPGAFLADYA